MTRFFNKNQEAFTILLMLKKSEEVLQEGKQKKMCTEVVPI